jgi:hypothetical protein
VQSLIFFQLGFQESNLVFKVVLLHHPFSLLLSLALPFLSFILELRLLTKLNYFITSLIFLSNSYLRLAISCCLASSSSLILFFFSYTIIGIVIIIYLKGFILLSEVIVNPDSFFFVLVALFLKALIFSFGELKLLF